MELPIELKVKGKRVLIVGGGKVAERKFRKLVRLKPALLRIVAKRISDGIREEAKRFEWVELVERGFEEGDTEGFDLIFIATNDHTLNRRVAELAKRSGALVNVADNPELCDFFMPAVVEEGRLTIAISTGGTAPSFSAEVKKLIREKLPIPELAHALHLLSHMRRQSGLKGRGEMISAIASDYVSRIVSKNPKGVYLVGFNHKTSPIQVRERALEVLNYMRDKVDEAILLSTCNRVELYFSCEGADKVLTAIPDELKGYLYFKVGKDVFKHLALVASGYDPLTLGETQMADKVKRAYDEARRNGEAGKLLSRLFEGALKASKKIKKIDILDSSISIPSLAVKLALRKLPKLEGRRIGVVGIGEAAQMLLKHLELEDVYLIGGDRGKLKWLSRRYSAKPVHLNDLEKIIRKLDLLFVTTVSSEPLIKKEMLERTLAGRGILIIDLSTPRNVEESVREIKGVECIFADELKEMVSENMIKEGERIAEEEAEKFQRWFEGLAAEQIIASLFKKLEVVPAEKLLKEGMERIKNDKELALAFKRIFGL